MNTYKNELDRQVARSQKIYSKLFLKVYDALLYGFANQFVWKCPNDVLLKLYNSNITNNHLEVGVGTGYLIDKCTFPAGNVSLGLMDLNHNCLEVSAKRLARYKPEIYRHNILEPFKKELEKYDSIGLNYVMHCIPGSFSEKGIIFKYLRSLLNKNGVLFGCTLLAKGVERNIFSKCFTLQYNAMGFFNNSEDNPEELRTSLKRTFKNFRVEIIGCVGLFAATDGIVSEVKP